MACPPEPYVQASKLHVIAHPSCGFGASSGAVVRDWLERVGRGTTVVYVGDGRNDICAVRALPEYGLGVAQCSMQCRAKVPTILTLSYRVFGALGAFWCRTAVTLAREGYALAKQLRGDTAGVMCAVREWGHGSALASALREVAKVAGARDVPGTGGAAGDTFAAPASMEVVVYIAGGGMGGSPPMPVKVEAGWTWGAFVAAVERMFGVTVKSVRDIQGRAVTSMRALAAGSMLAIVPGAVDGEPRPACLREPSHTLRA